MKRQGEKMNNCQVRLRWDRIFILGLILWCTGLSICNHYQDVKMNELICIQEDIDISTKAGTVPFEIIDESELK